MDSRSVDSVKLFLLDGSALAYRSYYAFVRNPLFNSKGENVSAVYGFTNTLLNILDEQQPEYVAVVFDTPEPTFRHRLFDQYKAQRAQMPEEMVEQLPRIRQMLEILGIPVLEQPGFEADDIMGTFARRAAENKIHTILVSADKDLMQLVGPLVTFYNPRRSGEQPEWLDEAGVEKKMGCPPDKIADYLALVGDKSDNIPGVPRIGPKSALPLIQTYGGVEEIMANLDKISNKRIRAALAEHSDKAVLSKQLATIHCNVPLETKPTELTAGDVDAERALSFFQQMEFRSLANRFAEHKDEVETDYRLVVSEEDLEKMVRTLKESGSFAFDTETTSLDPMSAELVGLSFCCRAGEAFYVPVRAPQDFSLLSLERVLDRLRPLFANSSTPKCGHNVKYDMLVLAQHGIDVSGVDFDTMVASYLLNPSARQHNLDALSLSLLNVKKIPTSSLIGSGARQTTMDQVDVEKVKNYACEDADMTWRLRVILAAEMKDSHLHDLYNQVEMPLVGVLLQMERTGVSVDTHYLAEMSEKLSDDLKGLEVEIYRIAGEPFNINSPKQLSAILFDRLKLPAARRTKTGYSTDVNVLEELARQHELPKQILIYRQLAKLKSTYVDALPRLINPVTGRLHTSFNQTVAVTGRLSSSEPNLQNIPIRTDIGRRIRRAFIPSKTDNVLLDADYSQIELRIMAHISGDRELLASFLHDLDVHRQTAAKIFSVKPELVTDDQRRKAKEINFGIMYGMGAFGLAKRLDITLEQGEEFIASYFATYPGVKAFIEETVARARADGFVKTLLNRRRYLPEINSDNRRMREFAERTAINTPIQGSAADLIKVAMIRIDRRLQQEGLASRMILQVHDELIFDAARDEVEPLGELVRFEMENAIKVDVPIRVDIGMGANWLEAH